MQSCTHDNNSTPKCMYAYKRYMHIERDEFQQMALYTHYSTNRERNCTIIGCLQKHSGAPPTKMIWYRRILVLTAQMTWAQFV